MRPICLSVMFASLASVFTLYAQSAPQPRRMLFDTFQPIVTRVLPEDRWIVVMSAKGEPYVAFPSEDAFIAEIVRENPIIFAGRVVDRQPVFLRLLAGQKAAEVSVAEANWIGSRITVVVDRIIQATDELPLTPLQRLTFVEEGDGSATYNGVRIDTETPWLEPIEVGRRYLISGRLKDQAFSSTGMWMDPPTGASMRPRFRGHALPFTPDGTPALSGSKTPFDNWTIEEASHWLDMEVQRRRNGR